jgi:hypothetical protein
MHSLGTGEAYDDKDDTFWCGKVQTAANNGKVIKKFKRLSRPPCGCPPTLKLLPPPGFNKYDRRNSLMVSTLGDEVGYLRGGHEPPPEGEGGKNKQGGVKFAKTSHATGSSVGTRRSTRSTTISSNTPRGRKAKLAAEREQRIAALEAGFWLLSAPSLVDARGTLRMTIGGDEHKLITKIEIRRGM